MLSAPDPLWYSFFEMAKRGEYGPGDPEELARTRYALLGNDEFHDERQMKHGPWLEARGVPVSGGSRLTIYRDITARKQAEQALLDANAELERRVAERTVALAESERHQASPWAIITDVLMPNMDGPTFIRMLNERGVAIPVAIASGRIEDRHAEELDRLNISVRLGKPFTQRRLMAVLDQLLVSGATAAR